MTIVHRIEEIQSAIEEAYRHDDEVMLERFVLIQLFSIALGYCYTANNQVSRGFVYLDGTMYDLNALVKTSENGLTIKSAHGINDLGQIVATATDAAGNEHAVILR